MSQLNNINTDWERERVDNWLFNRPSKRWKLSFVLQIAKCRDQPVFIWFVKPTLTHAKRQICCPHVPFSLSKLAWSCKTDDIFVRVDVYRPLLDGERLLSSSLEHISTVPSAVACLCYAFCACSQVSVCHSAFSPRSAWVEVKLLTLISKFISCFLITNIYITTQTRRPLYFRIANKPKIVNRGRLSILMH